MERTIHRTTRTLIRRNVFEWLGRMAELQRQRRALANLGPDLLEDCGISEVERRAELARRAWDVPVHWLR